MANSASTSSGMPAAGYSSIDARTLAYDEDDSIRARASAAVVGSTVLCR